MLPGLGDFSEKAALGPGFKSVGKADQDLAGLAVENGDDLVASVSELALPSDVAVLVAEGQFCGHKGISGVQSGLQRCRDRWVQAASRGIVSSWSGQDWR